MDTDSNLEEEDGFVSRENAEAGHTHTMAISTAELYRKTNAEP